MKWKLKKKLLEGMKYWTKKTIIEEDEKLNKVKIAKNKIIIIIIVRTQFVTTHNNIGFARKKAQTILFVERGFERLGLGYQTVVSRGVHTRLNRVRSRSLSPGGGLGGSSFWPFFLATALDCLLFLLY